MTTRFEKVLAKCSPRRPVRTKPLDHLSGLVIRAKDGKWEDLVEYLEGSGPITKPGRASLALLVRQLLEHRAGRPSGPENEVQEAKQIAVWFMHAARDRFQRDQKCRRLTRAQLEAMETRVIKHANDEFARGLKPPLKNGDLIGKGSVSKGHPYGREVSKNIEKVIEDDLWPFAPAIINDLVDVLTEKSKPAR